MAENKTKKTSVDPNAFLDTVEDERKRDDGRRVMEMMAEVTGEPPAMWGPSMIGFGNYHYVYESGREGDFFVTGFSPRKNALTIYFMPGFDRYEELMGKLGKHKTGKSCLYVKRLDDVDFDVLRQIVEESVKWAKQNQQTPHSA